MAIRYSTPGTKPYIRIGAGAASKIAWFALCWFPIGISVAADWKPDKNIEIIIPTTPASGVDSTARMVQAILQSRKLVETPVTVLNKPGGGYGVAMAYLSQFNGDGHRLFIQTSTPLTGYITGQLQINPADFTPIANLISEPVVVDLWRGLLGAKGLAPAQIKYWDRVFEKLTQSEEWRKDIERNNWVNAYKNSEETGKELKQQYDLLKGILIELGMAK